MVDLVIRQRVVTSECDTASSALAEVLGAGELEASGALRYEQRSLVDDGITVTRLACAADAVEIRCGGSPDLVVVAVRTGRLQVTCRDSTVTAGPQDLVLIPFNERCSIRWTDVAVDLYSFPVSSFVRTLGRLENSLTVRAPYLTSRSRDLTMLWQRLADVVTRGVLDRADVYSHDVVRSQLIDGLTAVTVEAFGLTNQQEDEQLRDDDVIRRADAYMRSHLDAPITVADVAAAVVVSVRSLQLAYQRRSDTTPVARLRRLRLDAARLALSNANPGTTVGDVGRRFGYSNLGRFSAHYRDEFDEAPSQTLVRSRPPR